MKQLLLHISFLLIFFFFTGCLGSGYISEEPSYVEVARPTRPTESHIWIEGNWNWNRNNHTYYHDNGSWQKPVAGRQYSQGFWQQSPKGKRWVAGRWH